MNLNSKKYIFSLIFFIFLSQKAEAAGIYDGIWQLNTSEYHIISENGGWLIVTMFNQDNRISGWGAGRGFRGGSNFATIEPLIYSNLRVSYDIFFTSLTTFQITLRSCVELEPGFPCAFLPHYKTGVKVW